MKYPSTLSAMTVALVLGACTSAWTAEPTTTPAPAASAPAAAATSAPAGAALLGAADFRPSPEHPLGWRGDGSGVYAGATPPTEWSLKKNVRWSTTVGSSYSSPVATDQVVLVTAEPNLLFCVDRTDGKVRWKLATKPADLGDEKRSKAAEDFPLMEGGAGMMTATPLTDGKSIYLVLANGIIRALDMDGKPKWITYIDAEPNSSYGRSASPVMVGGKLIVHMTNLYAFDPETGKQLWMNADVKSAYGTPVPLKLESVDYVATPDGDVVRVSDGKVVVTGIGRSSNPSPVAKDGVVYFGDSSVKAVRITPALKGEDLWSGDITGEIFGSPLLHEGRLFVTTGAGELYAFDAKAKGSPDPVIAARALFEGDAGGGSPVSYSSLALAGKYIFLSSNKGDTVVLEATPEAKVVATNSLSNGSGGTPTFSGKDLFIRDGEKLFCISQDGK